MLTLSGRILAAPAVALAMTAGTLAFGTPAQAADMDCGDFASQRAAQIFFLKHGGPSRDPHLLDSEGDGIACESNPAPYYYGSALPGGTTAKPKPRKQVLRQHARVIRVIDGDTVDVRLASGRKKRVRMIGIDTPEVFGGVECGGPAASRAMKRATPRGTRVVLVSDPSQDRVDRYGRLLRYVMKNGRDMNRAQVARGWARVYVYANTPFRRVVDYRRAQRAAQAQPRGTWRICR